jgi:poly-gamma-glutamate capsule biosynthesis protein CapA/YwtB (metallophosphatase superfamily)
MFLIYRTLRTVVWLTPLLAACTAMPPKTATPDIRNAGSAVTTDTVTLAAVGDMMLGGSSQGIMEQQGYDYPFATTRHILTAADLTIGNLETPLTNQGAPITEKQFLFRNPPEKVAPALKRAGFDIVSLANNHTLDYGAEGLKDTMAALDLHEIRHHGAGMSLSEARKPVILKLPNGQQAGFLAYSCTFPEEFWATASSAGTAFCHERHVHADVARLAEQKIDIIVVSFHWGAERMQELRPYQPLLAHTAIEAGADLVIGHHPHILQGIEYYREGLILYSLGNFTFGSRTQHARTSVVANIVFKGGRFAKLEMTPINVNNFEVDFQPRLLLDEKAAAVHSELQGLSGLSGLGLHNGLIVFEPPSAERRANQLGVSESR